MQANSAPQHKTDHLHIRHLAAEVGPVIEQYRAQGLGFRRIAGLLNLSGYSHLRGSIWHPTTVVRVWQTYTTQPVQLKLPKPPMEDMTAWPEL